MDVLYLGEQGNVSNVMLFKVESLNYMVVYCFSLTPIVNPILDPICDSIIMVYILCTNWYTFNISKNVRYKPPKTVEILKHFNIFKEFWAVLE